jgi:hypothetical protein
LWSISLTYLDAKGIVALWREALLARKVLEGKTKGYRNHPQLIKFKSQPNPLAAINTYLYYVAEAAKERGYNFDINKIDSSKINTNIKIKVTKGQLDYELALLKHKLKRRDELQYERIKEIANAEPNLLFEAVKGLVEAWEKVKNLND